MKIELPRCPYCGCTCQSSTVYGFFKCVNGRCSRYAMNVVDDLAKYTMIDEQWSDTSGHVHVGKKKKRGAW